MVAYASATQKGSVLKAKFGQGEEGWENQLNVGGKSTVLIIVLEEPISDEGGMFVVKSPNLGEKIEDVGEKENLPIES